MSDAQPVEKASIIVMSGDMDKVMARLHHRHRRRRLRHAGLHVLHLLGAEGHPEGQATGKGVMGRMLGVMNRGGIDRIGPSRFNFGGMGRWMFKKMMKSRNVTPLPELLSRPRSWA